MTDHRIEADYEDDKQFQKELERLKELAENGMELTNELRDLKNSDNPIHKAFAENVIAFESAHKNPGISPLREMLGNLSFPKVDDLSDDELEDELDKVNEILISKRIFLDILYPTDSWEIYRFITEELLDVTNGDIDMCEMSFNFTYEDFYPNFSENIKEQIEDIVKAISEKKFNGNTCWFHYSVMFKSNSYCEEDFIFNINRQLEIYDELTDLAIEVIEIEVQEDFATAQCLFTLNHETSNGEKVTITANAKFEFEFPDDCFVLSKISVPEMGM